MKDKTKCVLRGTAFGAGLGVATMLFYLLVFFLVDSGGVDLLFSELGGLIVSSSKEFQYNGDPIPFRNFANNQREASAAIQSKLKSPDSSKSTNVGIFWVLSLSSIFMMTFMGMKVALDNFNLKQLLPVSLETDNDISRCISLLSHKKQSYQDAALRRLRSKSSQLEPYLDELEKAARSNPLNASIRRFVKFIAEGKYSSSEIKSSGNASTNNTSEVCPNGHGPLSMWEGKLRCWTCGWSAK